MLLASTTNQCGVREILFENQAMQRRLGIFYLVNLFPGVKFLNTVLYRMLHLFNLNPSY